MKQHSAVCRSSVQLQAGTREKSQVTTSTHDLHQSNDLGCWHTLGHGGPIEKVILDISARVAGGEQENEFVVLTAH